jgi:hypothetical protein
VVIAVVAIPSSFLLPTLSKAKEKALRTVAMHPGSALPGVLTMDESPQDGVQNLIEMFAHIFRQESQHEKSVLLQ